MGNARLAGGHKRFVLEKRWEEKAVIRNQKALSTVEKETVGRETKR